MIFDTSRSILKRDPAAKSLLEVILLYPGVHALAWYRIANVFYKIHLFFVARLLSQLARFFTGIEIHPGATIGKRLFLDHGMGIVIGETSVIGDDCTIYHGVTLGGKTGSSSKRHPTLKNNVVIGANAQIIGNVTIGNHAFIGAGTVITKDVADHQIMVGVAGKPLSQ